MITDKQWDMLIDISVRLNNISGLEEGIRMLREAESLLSRRAKIYFWYLASGIDTWLYSKRYLETGFPLALADYINQEALELWCQRLKDKKFVRVKGSHLLECEYLKRCAESGVRELFCQPVIENNFMSWCLEVHNFDKLSLTTSDISIISWLANQFGLYWDKLRFRAKKSRRETQIKKLFQISTEPELYDLLTRVVDEIPWILKGEGCSVFLLPEFFPENIPVSEEIREKIEGKEGKVVVLAATNGLDHNLIGKANYGFGEGITGWIAMHGLPLNLADVSNPVERETVACNQAVAAGIEYQPIEWSMKYNESKLPREISRPFLGVPIKSPRTSKVIGVLRLVALQATERWSENYETILSGFAELLGLRIERDYITGTLLRILREGDKDTLLTEIANRAYRLVHGSGCSIFLQDEKDSNRIIIEASTLPSKDWGERYYKRNGIGCTAWIFTTGRSLILKNIQDVEELRQIDPTLKWAGTFPYLGCESNNPGSFIGVPIKVEGETIGVIRIPRDKEERAFTDRDLEVVETLAGQLSLVLELRTRLNKRHQLKEKERNRLINIYELGSKMQEEHYNFDRLCHIFLTGITHGDVIGLNRAVLFKYEPDLRQLKGVMALGPIDPEEAVQYKEMVENTSLSLGKCIAEFDHQGGAIKSRLQSKIYNDTFYLDKGCQCLALIENNKPIITEIEPLQLSKSLADFLHSIGAVKAILIILPATIDHSYVLLCDNIYTSQDIDVPTKDFLWLYIDEALKGFQRIYQEEEIRVAKEKVWRDVSAIAAHRLGHLLPIVENRLNEIILRKDEKIDLNLLQDTLELIVRANKTVSDFRRVSTHINIKLNQPITINELMKEFQNHLRETHKDVPVDFEYSNDDNLSMIVDLENLKSCIETLLDNSKDSTSEGLSIKVKISRAMSQEIKKFALAMDRPFYVISIEDNGPGVREDLKQKIFEPFFTTKSRGSGVGLTIVKQVIEIHGGKVVECGEFGRGATFKVFLPIYQKEA